MAFDEAIGKKSSQRKSSPLTAIAPADLLKPTILLPWSFSSFGVDAVISLWRSRSAFDSSHRDSTITVSGSAFALWPARPSAKAGLKESPTRLTHQFRDEAGRKRVVEGGKCGSGWLRRGAVRDFSLSLNLRKASFWHAPNALTRRDAYSFPATTGKSHRDDFSET